MTEISSDIHTTRLKERLLAVFPDLGAHNQGRDVLLVFNSDIGEAIRRACDQDSDYDALHLSKAAKLIRDDIFKLQQSFRGTFPPRCQDDSIPASLMTIVNLILEGPSIKKESAKDKVVKRACLTISQLVAFNSVKRRSNGDSAAVLRHNRDRENPLPIYIALKIYGETRKRSLIDSFFNMGLCISYDRLLTISTDAANSMCTRFGQDCVVCPPKLRSQVFTTAGVDNIDHNPSSTTARDSFHGTAISLTQHPTAEVPGTDRDVDVFDGTAQAQRRVSKLPESFANVPPSILGVKTFFVTLVAVSRTVCTSQNGLQREYDWLERLKEALGKEELDTSDFLGSISCV